jgi:DNA-binding Lrp family transcriptional regulator
VSLLRILTIERPPVSVLDPTDRRILRTLDTHPRATVQYLAEYLGLARGTVQSRLKRLVDGDQLAPISTRLHPSAVGRPLRAIVTAQGDQSMFEGTIDDLSDIPEVVEVLGISGGSDLSIEIIARDADDIYRITQRLMQCRGISRTSTSIVLRELLPRRMKQLLDADAPSG